MRIRIQNVDHEIPDAESFTLDESGVLFDYAGITLDRYYDENWMNPRLHQAWLHILLRRTQPDLTEAEVKQIVRDTRQMSIFAPDADTADEAEEPDDGPPASGRPPSSSSGWPENGDGSTKPSGNGGTHDEAPSPEPSPAVSSGPRRWGAGPTSEYETLGSSRRGSSTPAKT